MSKFTTRDLPFAGAVIVITAVIIILIYQTIKWIIWG